MLIWEDRKMGGLGGVFPLGGGGGESMKLMRKWTSIFNSRTGQC